MALVAVSTALAVLAAEGRRHDLRHVVYVFCANDLRNLHETGLTDLTPDNTLVLRPAVPNPFYRWLGRLQLTYLVISAYHRAHGLVHGAASPTPGSFDWFGAWKAEREFRARSHDAYADAVLTDLLPGRPGARTTRLARIFPPLLERWRTEVEARGRTFSVLVLPRRTDTGVATTLLREYRGRIISSNKHFGDFRPFKFSHDGHWNERGNLKAAEFLASSVAFPFHEDIVNPRALEGVSARIEAYYRAHR